MDIQQKASNLLNETETLVLSVVDNTLCAKAYAMSKVLCNELSKVIFIAKTSSRKIQYLTQNPFCSVLCFKDDDSVLLTGSANLIFDINEIKTIVPESFFERISKKGADNYCVIEFNSKTAEIYYDNAFYGVEIAL